MLADHKITEADIAAHGLQSCPDTLQGSAAQNKRAFDALVSRVVAPRLNALIDALADSSAAGQLGVAAVPGLSGCSTVQQALESLVFQMQGLAGGPLRAVTVSADAPAGGAEGDLHIQHFPAAPARVWVNVYFCRRKPACLGRPRPRMGERVRRVEVKTASGKPERFHPVTKKPKNFSEK